MDVKTKTHLALILSLSISLALLTGCATNSSTSSGSGAGGSRFKSTDGRVVDIGTATPVNNGKLYLNPHMEKAWVADGFNFQGFDTLYIAPTASTATFNEDEVRPHALAKERLVEEIATAVATKGVFTNVVTKEADIKPGARVLRLEQTITEYRKGGGAARYWAGLYGAGQPVIRVSGKAREGDRELFTYEARRSGVSASARMVGGFKTDVDIQTRDIQSLATDLSDFIAALAGKYAAK
jgi:hypothetical protein